MIYLTGDNLDISNHMNKYFAYLLGFLWADGNIYQGKINKSIHRIVLEINENDMNNILPYLLNGFPFTGNYTRQRKNWKPTKIINTNNKYLFKFLYENDYLNKSITPPIKILNLIPDNLKYYWIRGYFDGDGCIYINKKNYINHIVFSSSYNYNWDFITQILNNLNIKFNIINTISKNNNKSSALRIINKNDIIKFANYLYYDDDLICLKRKQVKIYSLYKEVCHE